MDKIDEMFEDLNLYNIDIDKQSMIKDALKESYKMGTKDAFFKSKNCSNCSRYLPGGYIQVDNVEDSHCVDCGRPVVYEKPCNCRLLTVIIIVLVVLGMFLPC